MLLLFLFIGNIKAGNCVPIGTIVTLTRQSEVDSFPINYPGCTIIDGSLIISGNDIIDLSGLNNLHYVDYLAINDNPNLININGLNNLDTVYNFEIKGNLKLNDLNGLNSLKVTFYFSIEYNSILRSLNGLDNLEKVDAFIIDVNKSLKDLTGLRRIKSIGGLGIGGNDSILNLRGLESLIFLDNFTISNNNSIINLNGLEGIKDLGQFCTITSNNSMLNFYGLENVEKFRSGLSITGNPLIQNLMGLNKVRYMSGLNITGNTSLRNFVGLNSLDTIGDFVVGDNLLLKNFEGLQNFKLMTGHAVFDINNNQSLCSINQLNSSLKLDNPGFYIRNNPNLNCCKVVDTILRNNPTLQSVNVYNNSTSCNDTSEIRTTTTQNCCTTKYTYLKDTLCQGEGIIFNNQMLTTSGIYYDTILVANSTDSIIILQLKVYNKSYQIINKTFCIGQSFTLSNGRVITTNGIYKDSIPNICDSIIEYHLNFLNKISVNQNPVICRGKTYTLPKGNFVSSSGIYNDTLQSAFGCDSIVITNLTITNPVPYNNNVTICQGKTYILPDGNIVRSSGTYTDTIKNINTCDSVVITNLIVTPYLQTSQTSTVCLGKYFVLPGGRNVSQSGTYKDTIRNNNGCDSIVTTNLSITNPIPFTNTIAICDGQSYILPNGNKVNVEGNYIDTIKNINTCDSVVITNLSIFPNNFIVSLNSTDTIESGNSVELKPIYDSIPAISWNWTPSDNLNCTTCENPVATPIQTAMYIVKATSADGCEDTAQTKIVVRQTDVYVPSAFTPNNDGINDVAEVFAVNPKAFSIKIFNRWGELVFESNDVNTKWNGTYKGENCPQDTYTYIIDVTFLNDKHYHKQSSVLLLR